MFKLLHINGKIISSDFFTIIYCLLVFNTVSRFDIIGLIK